MLYICYRWTTYVVHMLYMDYICCTYVIHMDNICCAYVIHMDNICCTYVEYMDYICCTYVIDGPPKSNFVTYHSELSEIHTWFGPREGSPHGRLFTRVVVWVQFATWWQIQRPSYWRNVSGLGVDFSNWSSTVFIWHIHNIYKYVLHAHATVSPPVFDEFFLTNFF